MEDLPAGGARPGRGAPEETPGVSPTPLLHGVPPAEQAEEDPEPGEPRAGPRSRTASLVSGLLTELYSCTEEEEAAGGGHGPGRRQQRRDSLDSSTEASGSDVFLGGRGGAGDSRVLQELQERPSQRHQMQYLRRKGEPPEPGAPLLPAPRRCPRLAPACAHLAEQLRDEVCGFAFRLSLVTTVSPIHDWTASSYRPRLPVPLELSRGASVGVVAAGVPSFSPQCVLWPKGKAVPVLISLEQLLGRVWSFWYVHLKLPRGRPRNRGDPWGFFFFNRPTWPQHLDSVQ